MGNERNARPQVSVEEDADALEEKFGELAETYAESRSEAADLRGAKKSAMHWRQVKEEVEQSDECD